MESNTEQRLEECPKSISPNSPRKQSVVKSNQKLKSSSLLKPNSKRHIVTQRSCDDTLRSSDKIKIVDYLSQNDDEVDEYGGYYTVLYDYKAGHDDELTLVRGNCIKVLSKDYKVSGDDGWWTGYCLNNGKKGIFPYNYVEPNFKSTETNNVHSRPSSRNRKESPSCDPRLLEPSLHVKNHDFSCLSLSSVSKTPENSNRELPPHIPYSELEFKNCIGAGGFGKVFRGYWIHEYQNLSDNNKSRKYELVAIKEARVEGDKDDLIATIKQNVLQEAKLFWMLRHPNIIQLKGICFKEPKFCLVMEYAKGGSLGRLLGVRKIGFPPYVLIKWALQVSQGK
jgi:mitogen-activated protein kinase kinase kinase 9